MAYNKAREERKWKQWKKKEEQQLRSLGMDEDSIQELRSDDGKEFKSERRFQQRRADFPDEPEWEDTNPYQQEITGIPELLDAVSDERLLLILLDADKRTLQILFLKVLTISVLNLSVKTHKKRTVQTALTLAVTLFHLI